MADEARVLHRDETPEDALGLTEIVGQGEAVQRLKALIDFAKRQNRSLPHILLVGRRGIGKRTLAMALAKEMGVQWCPVAPQSIERVADLMGFLTNLAEGSLVFLENVASIPRALEELLPSAMEKFSVDFVADRGLNARTMHIPLRPFTCVGTANRASDLRDALRYLFSVVIELKPYSETDLETIARTLSKKSSLELTPEAAALIARASNRELQQGARAILDLAGRPATRRVEVGDVSKALAGGN